VSDSGEAARTAASAIQRASVGTARFTGRAFRAYRSLHYERRLAAIASILLFFALFLPWYQETVIAKGATGKSSLRDASVSLSGWGAFSWVEAAVLLVALGVLTLLFRRAEGRAFHLPGGDGWIITLAGAWTCCLIVWRIFDKQGTSTANQYATTYGIEWGIFVALAVAVLLTYAGSAIRAAHSPEPPLPGEEGYAEKAKRGDKASGFYIPHASPTSETVAYEDFEGTDGPDADATEALPAQQVTPPARSAPRRARRSQPGEQQPPAGRRGQPRREPPLARRQQPNEEPPVPPPARTARPSGIPPKAGNAGTDGRPPSARRTGWLTARPMDPEDFPEDDLDHKPRRPGPSPANRPAAQEQHALWSDRHEYDDGYEDDGSDGEQHPTQQWDVTDFEYDRRVRSSRGRLPQEDPPEYEEGPADDVAYYEDHPQQPRPVRPRPQPPRHPEPYDIDASEDETIVGSFPTGPDASEDQTAIDPRRETRPYDADDPDDTLIDPTPRTERLGSGGSEDKTVVNPRWRRKRSS
jgi:hypothetical protein